MGSFCWVNYDRACRWHMAKYTVPWKAMRVSFFSFLFLVTLADALIFRQTGLSTSQPSHPYMCLRRNKKQYIAEIERVWRSKEGATGYGLRATSLMGKNLAASTFRMADGFPHSDVTPTPARKDPWWIGVARNRREFIWSSRRFHLLSAIVFVEQLFGGFFFSFCWQVFPFPPWRKKNKREKKKKKEKLTTETWEKRARLPIHFGARDRRPEEKPRKV